MNQILDFLTKVSENNQREWFDANRASYQKAKIEFETFIGSLIAELNKTDPSVGMPAPKDCIFRIFRDVRFSPNKEPYKTNFGAFIAPGGRKSPKSGYYLHIEPGKSMIGGGIYMPDPVILKKIRQEIYFNPEGFKSIINQNEFKAYFLNLEDFDKLKRPPKDYDPTYSDIDLLMYKSYVVMHPLSDTEVVSDGFLKKVTKACEIMKPFHAFINKAFDE